MKRGTILLGMISLLAAQDVSLKERDLTTVRLGTPEELKMPVAVSRGYAVVIGVSTYKNLPAAANLRFAEKDAQNVIPLCSARRVEILNSKMWWILGKDAIRENVRNALEKRLPSKAMESDRVIALFVGQGMVDEKGRGYIAPYDIDLSHVAETGYPMDRLGQVLSTKVKARWKVLLVDACHSGQITVDSTAERIDDSLRGLPQGVLTLTSSHASEVSYEDPALAGG